MYMCTHEYFQMVLQKEKEKGCKHENSPTLQSASPKNKDILLQNHDNKIIPKNINRKRILVIILYYQIPGYIQTSPIIIFIFLGGFLAGIESPEA